MSERPDLARRRAVAATVLAALPVAIAAARAAAGRWVPQGDDAYFTVRSLDVGTEHHPLLGAWSSGSADLERNVNNLGALQLDLLAPFTKLAPMGGTAVGVAVVHIASIVTVAWLVSRLAGVRAVLPAMVAVALMTWVMGSEMLITPRQHQYLLLPYLCVLVAAWAAARGDRWALVPFVAAGSLVTQTHLSYPILVAALAVPAVAGQVVAARRTGSADPFVRPWVIAGGLAVVLWSQTIVDQLFGWGNLGAVLASPGETRATGLGTGLRIVADVVVAPHGYLRPGFADFDPNARLGSDLQVVILGLLVVGLVAATAYALRHGRTTAASGLAVGSAALIGAIVDASQLPVTQFGLAAANYRWLWPTVTFLLLGVLLAGDRWIRPPADRAVPALTGAVLVLLVVLNLPTSYQVDRPEVYRDRIDATADLVDQLGRIDLDRFVGPVVIDQSRMYFGHPFAYPVAVALRERGIEYRLEGVQQARRFGESRVSDGTETTRLILLHSTEAIARRGNDDVVAYVEGPDPVALVLEVPS